MQTRSLSVLFVGLLVAADNPKDAKQADLKKLQGTWTATTIEYNGEKVLGNLVKELVVVVKDDRLTVKGQDPEVEKYPKATLMLDPTTTPKILDVTIAAGNEKDTKFEAIYEVTDDEWKVCLKPGGKERPAKFESKADSGDALIVFKREKE